MKASLKYLLLIIFGFITTFYSCSPNEDPDFFTPSDGFVDSNVKFSYLDTMSFKMSTFKMDSLATDLDNKLLVGQYIDPFLGKTTSHAFVNFTPVQYSLPDDAIFDSIVLNLKYSDYSYGDTLISKKIKVFELDENLNYLNGQGNFYNVSDFDINNILGERFYTPKASKDSIKITLNNSFGQNLFYKIKNGIISDVEELKNHYKGIKISPDESENGSIISFDVRLCYIRFYYHLDGYEDEVKYYDFRYFDFETNRNYFSQIYSDRTGTILPVNFSNQEDEVQSDLTNNLTYIQSGVGLVTKIYLPNFKERYDNLNFEGFLYKSELEIPINKNLYSDKTKIPDSLRVFLIDRNNQVINTLKDKQGKDVIARVNYENSEFNEINLNVPINRFIELTLNNNAIYKDYGVILIPFNYGSKVDRIIINGNQNPIRKSKLILTHLRYD